MILDSKGNIVKTSEGKPWDGKDPSYIVTPDGEEFYGEGLLTFTQPHVTPQEAAEIEGPMTPEKMARIRAFEKQIADDNEARRKARKAAGVPE